MKIDYDFEVDETGKVISANWIAYENEWGEIVKREYRTGRDGCGVWSVGEYEDKQICGTCDFKVCGCTKQTASKRIREYMDGTY